jgi:hypothetical protein
MVLKMLLAETLLGRKHFFDIGSKNGSFFSDARFLFAFEGEGAKLCGGGFCQHYVYIKA